jgi:hypothetical protein
MPHNDLVMEHKKIIAMRLEGKMLLHEEKKPLKQRFHPTKTTRREYEIR